VRSIGVDNFASAPSAETEKSEKRNNGKGLGADANADGMRTQTSDADANADGADGVRTQTGNGPSADNHQENNSFSESADGADVADANSATSSPSGNGPTVWPRAISNSPEDRHEPPPGAVFAKVEIREVWPPGLGPPGDDVFDLDWRWRQ
jgi:hypothetical protein